MMQAKCMNRISGLFIISLLFTISFRDALSDTVQFKPDKLNYNSALMDTCRPKKLQVINTGQTVIENPVFQLQDSGVFHIQEKFRNCPDPLEPGQKCQIYIDFCPPLAKRYETTLTFSGSQQKIQLKGRGSVGR
jgi:hypothetical protein